MSDPLEDGCELHGKIPAQLGSRCHPSAPLRAEMTEDNVIILYCFVPECNREVCRLSVKDMRH